MDGASRSPSQSQSLSQSPSLSHSPSPTPSSRSRATAAPLERSYSELSTASTRSRSTHSTHSHRSTVRASRRAKLASLPSSSASSAVDPSDKSLTSFPDFSPGSPAALTTSNLVPPTSSNANAILSPRALDGPTGIAIASSSSFLFNRHIPSRSTTPKLPSPPRASSIVDSLLDQPSPSAASSSNASNNPRSDPRGALFDDAPPLTPGHHFPGALHLADDEHVARLIARHGAVTLVRQVAEDLARRDAQIAALRARADDRERALRKIIVECGLSNLDLETRLRAVEQDAARAQQHARHVSDMVSDAMTESVSRRSSAWGTGGKSTIRAASGGAGTAPKTPAPPAAEAEGASASRGTMRFIKDYIWGGGGSAKGSRASSINGDVVKQPQTVVRASTDRRPTLQEDLFTPPDAGSVCSSSRASSINNVAAGTARKASTPFATLVRMVAGGGAAVRDGEGRGRAGSSSVVGGSLRTPSVSSQRTNGSARAVSTHGGPKSLMAMRRTTGGTSPLGGATIRTRPEERWDTMVSSPTMESISRQESYGPVEMDKILPLEGQPPTLSHLYGNYNSSGRLTDRFGFIYDQRRKKRQRTTQMAKGLGGVNGKHVSLPPIVTDDGPSARWDVVSEDTGRPGSPSSTDEVRDEGKSAKSWYDYLKVVTFQSGAERTTELLSDTPAISGPGIQVTEGRAQEALKSPVTVTTTPSSSTLAVSSDERGFVPSASIPTSALDTRDASLAAASSTDGEPASATFVKDEAEPVKQLLDQLNHVHDAQQRRRTDRWNEFQRKVRAERRRNNMGDAASSDPAAPKRMATPETRLADGELVGIADLGNKGKVGRAKWGEFRALVLGGIPVALRAKVWAECAGALDLRVPGYYDDLVARPETDGEVEVVAQIRADIHRTLTDNIFFRSGAGVARLHDVLLAYARRNPDVGYCQGMNLIAANLLLVTPSAEDAFWLLAAMVERILPAGYYGHSLLASRADQQVLRVYVTEVLPRLSAHFDALAIDLETMTFQWFLSVFTDCLSAEALFRVWDVVLCLSSADGGSTFLFQVALALLKLNEAALLGGATPAAVYTYINHHMTDHAISIDGLIQASEGLRRLVRKEDVAARRAAAVQAEAEAVSTREQDRAAREAARALRKATAASAVVTGDTVTASPTGAASGVSSVRSLSPAPLLGC